LRQARRSLAIGARKRPAVDDVERCGSLRRGEAQLRLFPFVLGEEEERHRARRAFTLRFGGE
jgi:hypothetical protein